MKGIGAIPVKLGAGEMTWKTRKCGHNTSWIRTAPTAAFIVSLTYRYVCVYTLTQTHIHNTYDIITKVSHSLHSHVSYCFTSAIDMQSSGKAEHTSC